MNNLAQVSDDEVVWDFVAHYIAKLCINLTLTLCPQLIVLGGGVMNRKILLPKIRKNFEKLLSGYVKSKWLEDVSEYIKVSDWGTESGIIGALLLNAHQE